MQKHTENYILDIITGKQTGFLSSLIKSGLWLLSWPYRSVVTIRNWAFDRGWFRCYSPPVPVVMSIGNIVVGGTGKTPITLMIAQEFYQDYIIAVLSRGYRSQAEKLPIPIILSNGEGPLQSALFCGDEPFLLSQNLPKAIVIVGKNRHKASDMAAKAGAQLILLDDGMQHRGLARDFEVVVMDSADPFGQGHFLPLGLLREGINSLSRADLIILNHATDNKAFQQIREKVSKYSCAPVIGTKMDVLRVEALNGEILPSLQGKKVGLFCGIAHPEYFYKTVSGLGAEIVDQAVAADHKSFDSETLKSFAIDCQKKGAEILLCTEKDKVKISDVGDLALPCGWVKMGIQIVEGEQEWQQFLGKVKHDLHHRIYM